MIGTLLLALALPAFSYVNPGTVKNPALRGGPYNAAGIALRTAGVVEGQPPIVQVPPTNVRVGFDHDGKDTDGYNLYLDGTKTDLGKLTPLADGSYEFPLPPMTVGPHTIIVSAYNNALAAEAKSLPLQCQVVIVTAPLAIRIKK